MSLYRTCMRYASAILFVIAILVLIVTAWSVLSSTPTLFESGSSQFDNVNSQRWRIVVSAVSAGLSSAVWPFFGSALLWQLDRPQGSRTTEAAE